LEELRESADRVIDSDVLIVGSEGAGATAAVEAREVSGYKLKVTIATKGRLGKCGATVTGDSDHDVDSRTLHEMFPELVGTDLKDSPEEFFKDMVRGGKYLNNQRLVEVHIDDAPRALKRLLDWGLKHEKTVIKASGHSHPRGLVSCGTKYTPIFRREVERHGVEVIPDTMIMDLLTSRERVVGAVGVNMRMGEFVVLRAKAVVLATGGCMRIYPITTAPEELTGDGMAMAYRAGAKLVNMEFPMFIPGGFLYPPAVHGADVPFLLSTAGVFHAWLLNRFGDRFMRKFAPQTMEHSTRDICSVAMMLEVLEGRGSPHGGIYVSLKHLPDNLIDEITKDPQLAGEYRYGGFNLEDFIPREKLKREAIEASPSCHFFNGGIEINERCETSLPGLFAAGETTGGVHGGNRLSGNAFTEMVVWGFRAGRFAAEYAMKAPRPEINTEQVKALRRKVFEPLQRTGGITPVELRKRIQKLAWEKVGVIRNGPILEEAVKEIEKMREEDIREVYTKSKDLVYNREWIEALQVENMLLCLEMIARASLMRTESRAAHYRLDYPNTDYINWTKNIVVKQVDGKIELATQPVVITKLKPPEKVVPYGVVE